VHETDSIGKIAALILNKTVLSRILALSIRVHFRVNVFLVDVLIKVLMFGFFSFVKTYLISNKKKY